jgi:DNA/RNA endonuclease YhcR with UshA esterase domain
VARLFIAATLGLFLTACGVPPARTPGLVPAAETRAPAGASPAVGECVPIGEAAAVAGRRVTVCGNLAEVTYRPGTAGQPTFLNFGRPYPNPTFVAVIWGEARPRFDPVPEARFLPGQRLCVSGEVELYRGTPQVVITDPVQVRPC